MSSEKITRKVGHNWVNRTWTYAKAKYRSGGSVTRVAVKKHDQDMTGTFVVEINVAALIQDVVRRCAVTKGRKAITVGGLITARRVSAEKVGELRTDPIELPSYYELVEG